MSIDDIIQSMVSELGQSQRDRLARELEEHFVDVDERGPRDRLLFAKALAARVHFYRGRLDGPAGTWAPFFPFEGAAEAEALLASAEGDTTPHLALLLAFLELYERPRALMNRLTARHLDFYYQRVLRFAPRPAVPDRAHVAFELKKNAPATRILPGMMLSAGKDAKGVERIYQPVRETVIVGAKLDALHSVFVDDQVRCAPLASSGDGVGGPLAPPEMGWAPFGGPSLPVGTWGFALSSPVLRMREGQRKVTLSLELGEWSGAEKLDRALEAFFTGEKGWLGPYPAKASLAGHVLELEIPIPDADSDKAVVDYAQAIHGLAFAADGPVVQVLLDADAAVAYRDLRGLVLSKAGISVDASGVTALQLESDTGALDPEKVFLPFGTEARKGARFMIGCAEALSKHLSRLSLSIRWHGLPDDFAVMYDRYLDGKIHEDHFTASATFQDGGGARPPLRGQKLFAPKFPGSATIELELVKEPAGDSPRDTVMYRIHALGTAGSARASHVGRGEAMLRPVLASFLASSSPAARSGFITLTLEQGFLHEIYRRRIIEDAINHRPGQTLALLNEPYTPAIERVSLSYTARTSEVDIGATSLASFSNPDLRFFHVDTFGQRQEHGYLRNALDHVPDKRVPLFPDHDEGELLLGFTGLRAQDSVSLLFEAVQGSADPGVEWPEVRWSVLADNHWKILGAGEVVLDTTKGLRGSGLLGVVLPAQATTENTLLPAGRVWLKASVDRGATAVARLLDVIPNGVEVRFVDRGNDPGHLDAGLSAGTIARLKTAVAAVKSLKQPQASFGGRAGESGESLKKRASERLRHKDRCVTPWDYERIVLEAFPGIHRVKCIPHAKKGSFLAPGNVLLVVVPDLRSQSARDPLEPRVDPDTLERIVEHAQARAGMQVQVSAQNPTYQKIRLSFRVKLRKGHAFNTYGPLLQQEIIAFLSPWAFDAEREISFGGRVYRSVLLDFVEERSYVDYVEDFKMQSSSGDLDGAPDISEAAAQTPDAILVSDEQHVLIEIGE